MPQALNSKYGGMGGLIRRPTLSDLAEKPAGIEGEQQILILWKKAIERFNSQLTKDEKKKLKTENQQQASFDDLLASAKEARDLAEKKRYRFTATVQRIFEVINQYAVAGDIIIQQHPDYTSLAWGAFRFLLLFAVQEGYTAEKLTSTLYIIAQTVFRADEYAKHFASTARSTDKILELLSENLICLYSEALNFLIRATFYFQKATMRRYLSARFKPFEMAFKDILDRINLYENSVQKDIDLLRIQRENNREEYENGLWLLAADFTTNLQKLQDQHLSGTGEWFLENGQVKNWIHPSSTSFLWVQGKPGSGKSTLAALLIRHLSSTSSAPIVNVFCKTGEENKNNLVSVLRNIIFQLLEKNEISQKVLHKIVGGARLSSKTQNAQSMTHLWSILSDMLNCISKAFCVIDALDECSESSNEVSSFVEELTRVAKVAKAKTKIAIISRLDQPSIQIDPQRLWQFLPIENSDVEDDIEFFVSTKLTDSHALSRKTPDIKAKLQKALIDGSQGMILWASLMISEVEAGHWAPLAVLEKPPTGLLALYNSILNRLVEKPRFTEMSRKLLLILGAARPLGLDELVFGDAMLGGASDDVHEHYSECNLEDEARRLINQISPLVTVMPDETVQLVHASLKDFLLGQELQDMAKLKPEFSHFSFGSQQLHEPIAFALVSYLSLRCFGEDTLTGKNIRCPLLEYASNNVIWHLTKTKDVSAETTRVFVTFFTSTQGWRWYERLTGQYGLSRGHLQVLQSRMSEWIVSICSETRAEWKENHLDAFIMILSKKRFEEATGLEEGNTLALDAMDNLADAYYEQGHLKEAEDLQLQALVGRKKVLGDDHPGTLTAVNNLANTYSDQGRRKEAEDLRLQVLVGRKKVLGDDHPDTLTAVNNLANTYSDQGRWKEAEDLRLQVLVGRKKVLGDDHPDTLAAVNNLAVTYSDQGRWKEAEDLRLQVLVGRKKVLGDDHPDTLAAVNNLANTYSNQGRWKEAEDLRLQVLVGRKKVLGDDHPDTLAAVNNLANTYSDQGRWKEAENLRLQVLVGRKKVLGDDHPDTLAAVNNLANTYSNQGRWKEAEDLRLQVLVGRKKVLGDDHPHTLTAVHNLAITYSDQGRWKEAEDLQLQVLVGRKKVLGDDHPDTLTAVNNLANTYSDQGRWKEAEDLRLQVLVDRKKVLGDDHPDTLGAMGNLAITYSDKGRWKEAEDLGLQVLAGRKKILGDDHPNTLDAVRNLAIMFEEQGRLEEAKTLRESAGV